MAGAGERQLSGWRKARAGGAEVGVRVLRSRGVLGRSRREEGDLVDHVLHLVGQRFGRHRRLWNDVTNVTFRLGVSSKFYCGSEALAGARATLERRLHDSYQPPGGFPTGVTGTGLMRLEGRRRRKSYFAMLAYVTEIEVEFAGSHRRLGSDRRKAQSRRTGVCRYVADLL